MRILLLHSITSQCHHTKPVRAVPVINVSWAGPEDFFIPLCNIFLLIDTPPPIPTIKYIELCTYCMTLSNVLLMMSLTLVMSSLWMPCRPTENVASRVLLSYLQNQKVQPSSTTTVTVVEGHPKMSILMKMLSILVDPSF